MTLARVILLRELESFVMRKSGGRQSINFATWVFHGLHLFRRWMPCRFRDHLKSLSFYVGIWRALNPSLPQVTLGQVFWFHALPSHSSQLTRLSPKTNNAGVFVVRSTFPPDCIGSGSSRNSASRARLEYKTLRRVRRYKNIARTICVELIKWPSCANQYQTFHKPA
jgi:hypothetical protein